MVSDSEAALVAYRRATQAAAFDCIGERYDEAFPHKDGQIEAGQWLIARLEPGARVLDAGCGTGVPTARQLVQAGAEVTGIDISPVMLELARLNVPGADFRLMDVADLDLHHEPALGSFDAVVAFFSLLMLPRSQFPGALARLHGVLRPGGLLALAMVEADVDNVPIPFLGVSVHVSGFFLEELRRLTVEGGFEILETRNRKFAPSSGQALPEIQQFLYCRKIP
ncbi:class I SAM-dependent methyltransferase [Actinospica durhamensis]|uniref:Class I SAM-dependent methyltransferase n=1 Tax=Actinospica durhamensis TaxID=1508375 RepID=A0A941IVB7_9ACTN|nr:class I SAM-dependent methyltransferase [Actinospica durhamensis]MBR7836861.1 class I SAM-dependent methyltransferase [Actinospica durhamensis]